MDCWPQVTHTHTKNHPAGLTKWTDSTLRWRSTAYENSWKSECFLNGACSLRYNKNHYKNKSLTSFWHGPWNECTTDVMHCSLKKGSSKLTTNLHSTSGMSVCPVRKHAVQVKVSIDAPERQQPPPPQKKLISSWWPLSLSLLRRQDGTTRDLDRAVEGHQLCSRICSFMQWQTDGASP